MQDRAARKPYIVDIYEKYIARCYRSGAMDFDDLLYQLYRLFQQNPDNVVDKYRRRFRYVHVDEFQDTNFLQYAILRQLVKYEGSPENIFIVGDDAQSIYAFRGATIDNILDFEKGLSIPENLQTRAKLPKHPPHRGRGKRSDFLQSPAAPKDHLDRPRRTSQDQTAKMHDRR